ncbi:DNA-binding domain-containing protein [Leucothrix mucor]|uniref:HvfC/BufC N-terminal domain-containing protein n=1 Tax=Leucothrix mucor TaxID=45248 RepID=UPI0003B4C6EB|nr:DNA-binding domain-containing protein [Leucothrix mucor]
MANSENTHADYINAFTQFMHSGNQNDVLPFLDGSRPAAFLSVYRNGYIKASIGALQSNLPCLPVLLGEEFFGQLAAAYVQENPPATATLVGYGFGVDSDEYATLSFIEYLNQRHGAIVKQYPYLTDICALDQAWLQALNANGEDFLSLEQVQALIAQGEDLGALPLALVDSSRLVSLQYDLMELWSTLRFGEQTPDSAIELKLNTTTILFWQLDGRVQARPLNAAEAVFMQMLQHTNFDQAAAAANEVDESFDLSSLFADLLNAQLLQLKAAVESS